jgi:outer membrane usher protein
MNMIGYWPIGIPAAVLLFALAAGPDRISDNDTNATASTPGAKNTSTKKGDNPHPSADVDTDTSADETLLLDLEVNGHALGKLGEFTLRRGSLLARPAELRDLGFKIPDGLGRGNRLIELSDLPGLTWQLDMQNQLVRIAVSDLDLAPTIVRPGEDTYPRDHRVVESGTGLTVNYDVVDTIAGDGNGVSAGLDSRAFSPWGILSSGLLAFAGTNANPSVTADQVVRLDSTYTYADVNSMRRYSLGDFISNSLSWTRPVHLLGAQIRSDFSTRPDLITFPLPTLTGSTSVPSTVDILADGSAVMSSQIAPGPFEVPQIPVVSGAGTISMTVTNSLGQQVTVNQPFYASYALLAKGLHTFATQAGLVRRNYGSASYDYGKIAGIGNYRRGMNSKTTLEADMEGTDGTFLVGGGGVQQIATLGELTFSALGSFGSAGPGGQVSAGAQRIGRKFSIGALATLANRDFRDIASQNGDGVLRKQLSGFTSLSLRHFGTGGVAYAGVDQDPSPHPLPLQQPTSFKSHVVSGNYSLQLRRLSLYANAFQSLDNGGGSGVQAGVVIPFGRRSSANVGWSSDGNALIQAQQSAAQIHDWGYQAFVSAGRTQHEFGVVEYKSPVGLFSAGVDSASGETTGRLEALGAMSVVDGGVFLSNAIYDSFAIVDTKPLTRVNVLQENRDVGSTGSSGKLLVPDMRAFELNHLAIAATELPADVAIHTPSREVRPQDRSGVVVKFPIKLSHGALIQLVDESGVPLFPGISAKLRATGVTMPVGYDGEVYVEDLMPKNELIVEFPDGRHCTATFEYHPVPGEIPTIGPLRCMETKP